MSSGRLPEGWRWAKLSELLTDLQAGFAVSARDPNGVRQLRMNNVTVRGTLDWSDYIRVPADQRTIRQFSLERGDIMFNNTNSVELVGKSALVSDLDEPTTFSNHFTRLRTNQAIEPGFLASYLRNCWQRQVFADGCDRWVGQAAFQARKLRELPIPLPPLAEQRRIAHAIDAAMAEAEAAARAAEGQATDLDRLEFRMFEDAFPVRPLALEKSEEAPEGWTWRLLTSVARLESGHTPSRRHPEWWGGDTPWIALSDIRGLDGREAQETSQNINEGGLANSSARLLPTRTVCLCRDVSVGFVTVMGRPMATSQHFVNWVCCERVSPWFLAYALMASREWLRSLSHGALLQTIYMPTLKAFRVCVPDDVRVQARIVDRIERCRAELRAARAAAAAQRSAVQALPAAILTAAFQGNL